MQDRPSLAKQFFEEFLAAPDRAAFLRALINSSPFTYETEWLEFKVGNLDDKVAKAKWSEALAGFATTEGGVLVWGVFAAPDPANDNLDHAHSAVPVPDPEAFAARLRLIHPQSTDPPVLGVVVEHMTEANGQGFVVCYVPENKFKPYRAEGAGRQYYVRAGASFMVPPPSLLRSLFYPISSPRIELVLAPNFYGRDQNSDHAATISIHLSNVGTSSADNVLVQLCSPRPKGSYMSPNSGWNLASETQGGVSLVGLRPIHPGMSVNAGAIHATLPNTQKAFSQLELLDDINLQFAVHGRDQASQYFMVVIEKDAPQYKDKIFRGTEQVM